MAILIGLLIIAISMLVLFCTVRSHELEAIRLGSHRIAHDQRAQKVVIKTTCLYLGAYLFLYTVIIAGYISELAERDRSMF